MKLVMGKDGAWREYKKPYITIECETEEDFEHIRAAMDFYKNRKLVPQKWIPVAERLPEEWEPVLVRSKFGFSEVAWYIGIGKWRYTANACLLEDGSVTNWMPLPEPPEMDGGE